MLFPFRNESLPMSVILLGAILSVISLIALLVILLVILSVILLVALLQESDPCTHSIVLIAACLFFRQDFAVEA